MAKPLLRTDAEITELYQRHVKTVYRVCFAYMKNPADTEDAVSDTFYRMMKAEVIFESEEHEKAWLIRTAASQMEAGMRGVFMPVRYDETSVYEANGKTLYLAEVARYGFLDGERWMFLEKPDGPIVYSEEYHPPFSVTDLKEAKRYVKERVGK